MKKALSWLDKNFEPILMAVLFYLMTILVSGQVVLRFVFNSGFSWGEEVSRFIFVWLMYFSISYATRNHRHINVTFVIKKLNEKAQKIMMIIVDFLFLVFSVAMFVSTIKICQSVIEYNDRAVTVDVSMNAIYGAGLVGFILIVLRVFQGIIWKFRNFKEPIEYFENSDGKYTGSNDICFMNTKDEARKEEA